MPRWQCNDVEEPNNKDDKGDDELNPGENSDKEDMEYIY